MPRINNRLKGDMNRKIIHDRFLIIYFHFSFDIILFLSRIDLIIYFFLVRKTKQVELLIFISNSEDETFQSTWFSSDNNSANRQ